VSTGKNCLVTLHPELEAKIKQDMDTEGRSRNIQMQYALLRAYNMDTEKYLIKMQRGGKTAKRPQKNGQKRA
jgi:hypothetical protein